MSHARPPRLGRVVLWLGLRGVLREVITGDLAEQWSADLDSGLGLREASRRYRRAAFTSVLTHASGRLTRDGGFRAAPLASGGVEQATQAFRDQRRLPLIETAFHDARYGVRLIRRSPGFAAVVVGMLAIGIGANTAIYGVTKAALAPLPIPDSDRVVLVWTDNAARAWRDLPASAPDFTDWAQSGIFASLGAFDDAGFNVRFAAETLRVNGRRMSAEAFRVFGVPPALGRWIEATDCIAGQDQVVILSDAFWRARLTADPAVIGREIMIDGAPHRVVGVLRADFPKLADEDIYTPLVFREPALSDRGSRNLTVVGRLAPRLSLESAQQRLTDLSNRLGREYPTKDGGNVARLQPIQDAIVEDARVLVVVLFGAVGLMLLIACANIGNLLLARGAARTREMALRTALGASRWRLCRQLLAEHLLLGGMGGVAALLPALVGMRFIASFQLDQLPHADRITLNTGSLAFNIVLSLATSAAFGLVPVWQAWQADARTGLRSTLGSTTVAVRHRLRGAFVVIQFALAIVLLVVAGLLVRSFEEIRKTNPGYDPGHVLTLRVALSETRYASTGAQVEFFDRLRSRIQALPGVIGVSAANEIPTSDDYHGAALWTSDAPAAQLSDRPIVLYLSVLPDYFHVIGTSILRGRAFADTDRTDAPLVALLDRSTAARIWRGESPIGKRFKLGQTEPWREVVGVVGDVEQGVLVKFLKGRLGQVYLPFAQAPKPAMSLVVRASGDMSTLIAAVRDVARTVDLDQPLFQMQTLVDARAAGQAVNRLAATLLATFASVALLLATLGIYGVVANTVGERMREFGIRLSLGAQPRDVLNLVFRRALFLIALGTVVGLAAAEGLTRLIASLLVGVRPTDPTTFAAVVMLLTSLGLVGSYLPARHATRADPRTALRYD
jgi:putative ABC transport system permease protein